MLLRSKTPVWQKRPGGVRVYRPSPCPICGSARRPNGTCGTCSRWAEANYISWLNQPAPNPYRIEKGEQA